MICFAIQPRVQLIHCVNSTSNYTSNAQIHLYCASFTCNLTNSGMFETCAPLNAAEPMIIGAMRYHFFMSPEMGLYSQHDLDLVKLVPETTAITKPMDLANHHHVSRIATADFKPSFELKTTETLTKDTAALAKLANAAEAQGPRLSPRTADSMLVRPATLVGARIDQAAKRPKFDSEALKTKNPAGFKAKAFDVRKAAAVKKHYERMLAGRATCTK